MPFIPAPQIIMCEFRYTLYDVPCENRVMVDNLAAVDAGDLSAVAVAGWNWAELVLFPFLSNQLHLREVVATDLTTDTGGQYVYAPDSTTVGGVGGSMLPNETAFCVSLRSTSRGRSARGRMFLAGIPTAAQLDPNHITPTYVSNYVTAVQGLVTAIGDLDKQLVIVSYRHDNVVRPGGPVYFPVVTASATDGTLDSQRGRKP